MRLSCSLQENCCALRGYSGEANGAPFYQEDTERVGRCRSWANKVYVVNAGDDVSCPMRHGHALIGALERFGEHEEAERVPLFHATGGEDGGEVVWRYHWHPSEETPRRAAVCPGDKRKERGCVILSCVKDCLA
jgi:hypothetical protein